MGRRFSLSSQRSVKIAGSPVTNGERPVASPSVNWEEVTGLSRVTDSPSGAVVALIGDPYGSSVRGRGEASGLSFSSNPFFLISIFSYASCH